METEESIEDVDSLALTVVKTCHATLVPVALSMVG
jgi:hypothetical protein